MLLHSFSLWRGVRGFPAPMPMVIVQDGVQPVAALVEGEAGEFNGHGNLPNCTQFRVETAANLLHFRCSGGNKKRGQQFTRVFTGDYCGVDETRTRGLLRDRKLRAVAPFTEKPHIKSALPASPFV
jgi:hypothetical protein